MKQIIQYHWLLSITTIAFISLINSLPAQSVIPVSGLSANHEGVAGWNADGTGPEPAKTGHIVPGVGVHAYYYSASRDYGGIDTSSTAAFGSGMGTVTGFPQFMAALSANGFSISQLKLKVGLQSLGNDIQGEDWMMNGLVETRYYRGGTFIFELNGEKMAGGLTPRLTVVIDYSTFPLLTISAVSDFVIPADSSAGSSPGVQEAAAFLADIDNFGIRIVIPSLHLLLLPPLTGNGRSGAFFEFASGQIERGAEPLAIPELSTNYLAEFELMQNYPNPFNPETTIRFALPEAANVTLEIYNALGQKVRMLVSGNLPAGHHTLQWNARDDAGQRVASGVYIYRLAVESSSAATPAYAQVKKMVLMK